MILIEFTAVCPLEGLCPNVTLGTPSVEYGFETLSRFVVRGWQLIEISLWVEGQSMPLPIEAFDGKPMLEPLNNLRYQWQSVLA